MVYRYGIFLRLGYGIYFSLEVPLSFREVVLLRAPELSTLCDTIKNTPLNTEITNYEKFHGRLTEYLQEYLLHGGYLPAISEYLIKKTISKAIFDIYIQWIIGDILKHNKNENYLYEIFKGINTTYGSQISWNNISKHLSIEHQSCPIKLFHQKTS
ncbi:putative ATPase [Candidatus Omnitrophus magneticus]|uniref:Putative ATPase n=1 Tax=Candidatus Omnitrophus magneticus TaxID=1609969 RepID=A0A0F0CS59_9BACT|nr:putative ATPase [Candidatus Omnitrophus magneticus]